MVDRKSIMKAVSYGYLGMGLRASNGQYENFVELLKQAEGTLAEEGVTIDWVEESGRVFQIQSPVGLISVERRSFLDDDTVGAALVFYSNGTVDSSMARKFLGSVRLICSQNWRFSGDVEICDHMGRNVPASAAHIIRLALEKKLGHDHEIVMT